MMNNTHNVLHYGTSGAPMNQDVRDDDPLYGLERLIMQPEHTLGPINQHELQDDKNIDDVGQRIRNIEMFGQSSLNMINPGLGIQ